MSKINIIKNEIRRFLASEEPEVLAIKGNWGVGKTYAWIKFLEEAKSIINQNLNSYSYVSLFGTNNLDDLKYSIFEQSIDKNIIGEKPDIDNFKKRVDSTWGKGKKLFKLLGNTPWTRDIVATINSLSFLSIKKTIVCIDDIERRGRGLEIKDVMGMVSLLKEQKNCKIVMILNDGVLSKVEQKEFDRYREKVIDIELLFDPVPSDCVEIVLTEDDKLSQKLKERLLTLGIKNIRVIKKIERLARLLNDKLSQREYEDEILHQALSSLVLFAWCYYGESGGENKPPINWIKDLNEYSDFLHSQDDVSEEVKKWKTILDIYKYSRTEKFDLIIFKVVETGYIDETELHHEAERINNLIISSKSKGSIREAWNLLLDSFNNDEDDFIQNIFDSHKNNIEYISPIDLNSAVSILLEFDYNEKAEELLSLYIEVNKNDIDAFCLQSHELIHVTNKMIIERFDEIQHSIRPKKSLSETLDFISQMNGWNPEEIEILSKATEDDFYNVFKNTNGPQLVPRIRGALQFGHIQNATPEWLEIYNRAKNALIRIGNESKINRKRVGRYIKLND